MATIAEKRSIFALGWDRTVKIAASLKQAPLVPMIIIGVFAFTAIFANVLTPHSPTEPTLDLRLMPPFWMEGGSLSYPLGTDLLGRDMLTRIVYGARVSITVSLTLAFFLTGISVPPSLIANRR